MMRPYILECLWKLQLCTLVDLFSSQCQFIYEKSVDLYQKSLATTKTYAHNDIKHVILRLHDYLYKHLLPFLNTIKVLRDCTIYDGLNYRSYDLVLKLEVAIIELLNCTPCSHCSINLLSKKDYYITVNCPFIFASMCVIAISKFLNHEIYILSTSCFSIYISEIIELHYITINNLLYPWLI